MHRFEVCDLRESSFCRSSSFRLVPSQCILGIEGGALGRAPVLGMHSGACKAAGAKPLTSVSQKEKKQHKKDFLKLFSPVPIQCITGLINTPTYFNCLSCARAVSMCFFFFFVSLYHMSAKLDQLNF